MNKLLVTILAIAICGVICLPGFTDPIGPKPGELTTVGGFQLSITAKAQEFDVCTPVTVEASIKNVTDKPVPIAMGDPRCYRLQVTTGQGKDVPLTSYGSGKNRFSFISRGPLDINPGETTSEKFIVNRIYDMTERGEYTVKIFRSIGFSTEEDHGTVPSNVLHITVK